MTQLCKHPCAAHTCDKLQKLQRDGRTVVLVTLFRFTTALRVYRLRNLFTERYGNEIKTHLGTIKCEQCTFDWRTHPKYNQSNVFSHSENRSGVNVLKKVDENPWKNEKKLHESRASRSSIWKFSAMQKVFLLSFSLGIFIISDELYIFYSARVMRSFVCRAVISWRSENRPRNRPEHGSDHETDTYLIK